MLALGMLPFIAGYVICSLIGLVMLVLVLSAATACALAYGIDAGVVALDYDLNAIDGPPGSMKLRLIDVPSTDVAHIAISTEYELIQSISHDISDFCDPLQRFKTVAEPRTRAPRASDDEYAKLCQPYETLWSIFETQDVIFGSKRKDLMQLIQNGTKITIEQRPVAIWGRDEAELEALTDGYLVIRFTPSNRVRVNLIFVDLFYDFLNRRTMIVVDRKDVISDSGS